MHKPEIYQNGHHKTTTPRDSASNAKGLDDIPTESPLTGAPNTHGQEKFATFDE